MNVALILAGGSGSRTEQSVPKQFLAIYDKPIIIYTALLAFMAPWCDYVFASYVALGNR